MVTVHAMYTALQQKPRYIFLIALIAYLAITRATLHTPLASAYLAGLLVALTFYCVFLSPTGREYGDQRRALLYRADRDNPTQTLDDSVTHRCQYLVNSDGGLLYTHTWQSSTGDWTNAKCIVLLVHGYSDHSSGLKHLLAQWLVGEGFIVAGLDHRGHGRSDGLHVSIESFDPVVSDIMQYVEVLQSNFPSKEIILYSESMGGAIAFRCATEHSHRFAGVVFAAPMTAISPKMQPPNVVTQLLLILMKFVPTLPITLVPDVAHLAFKNQAIFEQMKNSVIYFYRMPRLSTAACMLFTTIDISKRLHELDVPLLIQHGTDDKVTDPNVSKRMYEEARSADKTLRLYEGAWHSLLVGETEETIKQVKQDLLDWLNAHCQDTASSSSRSSVKPVKRGNVSNGH